MCTSITGKLALQNSKSIQCCWTNLSTLDVHLNFVLVSSRKATGNSGLLNHLYGVRNISSTSFLRTTLPRITVTPTDAAQKIFEQEGYKPRKSPGHFPKRAVLPSELHDAAKSLIKVTNLGDVEAAQELRNYLKGRRPPLEDGEYKDKANTVEQEICRKNSFLVPFLSEKENKKLEQSNENKIKRKLKSIIYHWEPIDYTKSVAFQYLVGRTPGEYAALYRIFYELSVRDPNFQPTTLLDFGSGVGSVTWAVNAFWKETLKEHMCIDMSNDMIDLADLLLRRGAAKYPLTFPGVHFRQFLPTSAHRKYDLIVSSYTILDLPSLKDRIQTIDVLWKKTEKYLVLVEQGTNAGFRVLNEAREYILQLQDNETSSDDEDMTLESGHVFSPCPHDFTCPRLKTDNTPCNFKIRYDNLIPIAKQHEGVEIFSYIVFRKGPRDKDENGWPRLVREPLRRPKHVVCRLCTKNGDLSEAILTKAKHSRELYRTARKSCWGDLLPVDETTNTEKNELPEPQITSQRNLNSEEVK